ncbi:MAG: hypothetical protein AAF696_17180, partial [Bacteroidota bacterium]
WRSPIGKTYKQSLFIILILRFLSEYLVEYFDNSYGPFSLIPFDLLLLFFYFKRTREKYKKGFFDYAKLTIVCLYTILSLSWRYFNSRTKELDQIAQEASVLYYQKYYGFLTIQVVCIIFLILHLIAVYRYKGDGNVREENLINEIGN